MTTEAKRPTKPDANRPTSNTVAPARSSFVAHVARWAGLSVVQFVLVEYIVSATWRGLYSYRNNYISELGIPFCGPTGNWPCSELYVLLNASMVLFGVAIAAVGGSWYIVRRIDGRAASFFVVAGAGAITAGVVNQGVNYPIHSFGATVFFVFGNFGLVIAGGHGSLRRPIRVVVTALGAVGLAGYFAYMSGHEFGLGIGSMERIATYALLVGIVVLSVSQFKATRVPKTGDETT
ncbi:DUF998 domain-containing protein [Rhodococcus sp. 15-725-2-2b]|uniref:DUF998 domain-containing protein n=1 Tax=unclassified Rhodococcus (in: high G+C Gram-positive bacteria) TaxID=192944 RepID=UPI0005D7AD13|nr:MULTISPECIES: DUF998 domain-containing protein [unclassified Rhodococcus (in: high G+C Gram-positive bacteria)]AJW40901.1 hypothetical protein NY08_2891 [Rhodococcus sp. B7740]OZC62571.1 DUF998 domain-containing protein [Rhodococcus sp. 06-469-3-2]OZC81158.1 DUF998 domain-containing protein [Rhodococcus sp. 06-418-5]OZD50079.1 DUF998 domain-containing protein [Rhodococcus sp. 06-1477-1A]OZE06888.1 DUF998 domain-containing protein [Rhodococcus sp. 05-2255-3B1]